MTRGAGARGVRWVALLMVLAWLVVGGIGGPLVGRLSEVQTNDNSNFLPASAESTAVNQFVLKATDTQSLPYLVVVEKTSGADRRRPAGRPGLRRLDPRAWPSPRTRHGPSASSCCPPQTVVPSQDKQAVLIPVAFVADKAEDTIGGKLCPVRGRRGPARRPVPRRWARRAWPSTSPDPAGSSRTSSPPSAGSTASCSSSPSASSLVILLIVYRSPILPFAVLVTRPVRAVRRVVGDLPAGQERVDHPVRAEPGHPVDPRRRRLDRLRPAARRRYKEELHDNESTWVAMKAAWRAAVEPIAASAATVILGLLCLLLSELGNTSGLGPVGALGIAGAFIASLTFLPAVLLLFGRRIFWPGIPQVDHAHAEDVRRPPRALGPGRGDRRRPRSAHLGRSRSSCWPPGGVRPDVQGQRRHAVGPVPHDRRLGHRPGGPRAALPGRFGLAGPDHRARGRGRPGGPGARHHRRRRQSPQVGLVPGQPPKVVDGKVLVQATLVAPADSLEAE